MGRPISRNEVKHVAPVSYGLRAKSGADESSDVGWVEGYAAVWNNVDLQKEMMVRGCFERTLQADVAFGDVKLMVKHFCQGGDVNECIGTITEAHEDATGLFIHAEFSSVQLAQDTRTKINEGHVRALSVGYKVVGNSDSEYIDGQSVVVHRECRLVEVTVTCHPANPLAYISGSKVAAGKVRAPDAARMHREIYLRRAQMFLALLDV